MAESAAQLDPTPAPEDAELVAATKELETLTDQLSKGFEETTALRKTLLELANERRSTAATLVAELQSVELELLSYSAQQLPEWVASVDPKRSRVYYINTQSQDTTWDRPEGFDGTFIVIDDETGLTAHARIDAASKS